MTCNIINIVIIILAFANSICSNWCLFKGLFIIGRASRYFSFTYSAPCWSVEMLFDVSSPSYWSLSLSPLLFLLNEIHHRAVFSYVWKSIFRTKEKMLKSTNNWLHLINVDLPDSPAPRRSILYLVFCITISLSSWSWSHHYHSYCLLDSRLSRLICLSMSELILLISLSLLSGQQQGMGRKMSSMTLSLSHITHYSEPL